MKMINLIEKEQRKIYRGDKEKYSKNYLAYIETLNHQVYGPGFQLKSQDISQIKFWDQIIEKQKLNKGKSFILKTLFLFLKHHPYGVIHEAKDFNPFINMDDNLNIVLSKNSFQYLKRFINSSELVCEFSFLKYCGIHKVCFRFGNGEELTINFMEAYIANGVYFGLSKKSILNSKENMYGVKQVSAIDSLEYLFCYHNINNSGVPLRMLDKILPNLKSDIKRLFNYINQKYSLNINSKSELICFDHQTRERMLNVVLRKKENVLV